MNKLFLASIFLLVGLSNAYGNGAGFNVKSDRFITYPLFSEEGGSYGSFTEENTALGSVYTLGTTFSAITTFQTTESSSNIFRPMA